MTLFESAVIENDISKSVQRYQLAVQQSKVRLDYALSPGCWLMPSNLVINTQAVAGYNNKLQRATTDMKFGANDINMETTGGLPHVDTKKTQKAASNGSMGVYVDDPKSLDNLCDLFVDFYSGTSKSTIARGAEKVLSALMLTSNEVGKTTAR